MPKELEWIVQEVLEEIARGISKGIWGLVGPVPNSYKNSRRDSQKKMIQELSYNTWEVPEGNTGEIL